MEEIYKWLENIFGKNTEETKYVIELPEVQVEEVNPEIGREVGRRFQNQVLPNSVLGGDDYKFSSFDEKKDVNREREKAVLDSVEARYNRGNYKDAILAYKEMKNVPNSGTIGCIGSATYPYAEMFGPEFQYYNNAKLYLDTKDDKSPYRFVYGNDPWNVVKFDQEEVNKLHVGDILSHLNDYNVTPDTHGHALMITGINRDSNGNITDITFTQDLAGMPMPNDLHTTSYTLSEIQNDDELDTYDVIYRPKVSSVKKYSNKSKQESNIQILENEVKEILKKHNRLK